MFAIAGQIARPKWLNFFLREPMGIMGVTLANFFSKWKSFDAVLGKMIL